MTGSVNRVGTPTGERNPGDASGIRASSVEADSRTHVHSISRLQADSYLNSAH